MADRIVVLGVLSWTRGDGARITRTHARRYGVSFPLWHDGPVGVLNAWSPTTVIFDRTGEAVAWARGDYHFANPALPVLLEALAR
jgi:hypothetical protein